MAENGAHRLTVFIAYVYQSEVSFQMLQLRKNFWPLSANHVRFLRIAGVERVLA